MILPDDKIRIMDDFFDPEMLQKVLDLAKSQTYRVKDANYQGYESENPVPPWIAEYLVAKMNKVCPLYYSFNLPRFRLALESQGSQVDLPHHDIDLLSNYPRYSFIIYLSDPTPDECLAFYEHESLGKFSMGDYQNVCNIPPRLTTPGCSNFDRWNVYNRVPIKKNRVVMFASAFFHRPIPSVGRGTDVETGRLILPVFINLGFNVTTHKYPDPNIVVISP